MLVCSPQPRASASAASGGPGSTAPRRAARAAMGRTASWTAPATTTPPATASPAAATAGPAATAAIASWVRTPLLSFD